MVASLTGEAWRSLGTRRRSGVATPLFSIFSSKSTGIGEIPDLCLLADWCEKTGLSIIQLLPMNDTGLRYTPYDSASTFALDPMYLSLEKLLKVELKPFRKKIRNLKSRFPCSSSGAKGEKRVDYGIKKAKLEIFREIFETNKNPEAFGKYQKVNASWLEDYALFKILKQIHGQASWETWPEPFRRRDPASLERVLRENAAGIIFEKWLQWQLFEQMRKVRSYALKKNIFIMGDLPFLVSKDSADVWAHQDYFKMDRIAGAPPDAFFARGQRWGMPPYHWEKIAEEGFQYLKERLRYAENFYDLFRIDHCVGTFRLWTISLDEPPETDGLNGVFDPADESQWETHGREILSAMIRNTRMLPCAEDLGVVPACSYRVLDEFGIPGMEVQRWAKEWNTTGNFKPAGEYREKSMVVISTHDTTSFGGWWEYESGTVDGEMFSRICQKMLLSFESIKGKLFDLDRSCHGRLRWRSEVSSEEMICRILERPEDEIREILAIHRGSFDEKNRFWQFLGFEGQSPEKATPDLLRAALRKAGESTSVFSIQLLQDWLGFAGILPEDPWKFRINFPSTVGDHNWTLVMPVSLEELNAFAQNHEIRALNEGSGRIV